MSGSRHTLLAKLKHQKKTWNRRGSPGQTRLDKALRPVAMCTTRIKQDQAKRGRMTTTVTSEQLGAVKTTL